MEKPTILSKMDPHKALWTKKGFKYSVSLLLVKNILQSLRKGVLPMIETTTISSKGQVTVPLSFRKKLNLKEGSKVAFIDGEDGRVYVLNASSAVLAVIMNSFSNLANATGIRSEEEADEMVYQIRHGK